MSCVSVSAWAEVRFSEVASALGAAWLEGQFQQQKTIVGLPLPLISSGRFYVQDNQLRWLTEKPMQSELQFSSQGISQWQKGEKVWQMTAQQQPVIATISQLMLAMMAGQWSTLDQAFQVQAFEQGEGGCWSLVVVSKDPVLSHVVQQLDVAGCERVTDIALHEVSGNVTALNLSALAQGEQ
ncbi:hypothetical protein R50072_28540 [Simiduia litorea]